MVLIGAYWFLAFMENKKRDKSGILEGFDHAYEDDLTDKKVCNALKHHHYILLKANSPH